VDYELRRTHTTDDLSGKKLALIRRVLAARRRDPSAFAGGYHALAATGPHADRVFAYARTFTPGDVDAATPTGRVPRVTERSPAIDASLVVIVPRLGVRADGWRDTFLELPPGTWRDLVSEQAFSGRVEIGPVWRSAPICVLVRG
jgi:(1->4)-alpha-D-glucan 1-alpha-D-glucosylmutase